MTMGPSPWLICKGEDVEAEDCIYQTSCSEAHDIHSCNSLINLRSSFRTCCKTCLFAQVQLSREGLQLVSKVRRLCSRKPNLTEPISTPSNASMPSISVTATVNRRWDLWILLSPSYCGADMAMNATGGSPRKPQHAITPSPRTLYTSEDIVAMLQTIFSSNLSS